MKHYCPIKKSDYESKKINSIWNVLNITISTTPGD